VIRNVVMLKLRADADRAAAEELFPGFRNLNCPGTLAYTIGFDAGLRDGNWSVAIVADFEDVAAYRNYDADPEHSRLRGLIGAMAEQVSRVQFEID
jgi:hypothetical protein